LIHIGQLLRSAKLKLATKYFELKTKVRKDLVFPVALLAAGLLFMGLLRLAAFQPGFLTPVSGLATPGYVLVTVFLSIWLVRGGLPIRTFGFHAPRLKYLALLVFVALVVLRATDLFLSPVIEEILGGPRNLERFANVEGSLSTLVGLLALNWTLAAFGEEFAYRIVLMRGIAYVMGDSRRAMVIALLLQAAIFGLVHAYQGPTGILGAGISGFIFGLVTLAGRWSIWPSALAHGLNNTIGLVALYLG
jgi:membrane protease YdiL (CAAX protease family)